MYAKNLFARFDPNIWLLFQKKRNDLGENIQTECCWFREGLSLAYSVEGFWTLHALPKLHCAKNLTSKCSFILMQSPTSSQTLRTKHSSFSPDLKNKPILHLAVCLSCSQTLKGSNTFITSQEKEFSSRQKSYTKTFLPIFHINNSSFDLYPSLSLHLYPSSIID